MHITKEFKYSDFKLYLQSRGIDRYVYEAPELYKQLVKNLILDNLDDVVSCVAINIKLNENLDTVKLTMWIE